MLYGKGGGFHRCTWSGRKFVWERRKACSQCGFGMVGEGGLLRGKAKILAAILMWFIELPCRNIVPEITRCVKACGFFFKTNLQVTCREFLASIFLKTILDKSFKCQSIQGHNFP